MAKVNKAPSIDTWDKENRQKVTFNFGKGGMKQPEDFGDLSVDQEITATVTGKVTLVRADKDSSCFELAMTKVELECQKDEDDKGLGGALDKAAKKREV